ncbi:MAG: hypothetical protein C4523_21190 [Myxococcales bacterium]|nr:MAG: hypothetical protein C4523_21190 [Myxococcales bacterium]
MAKHKGAYRTEKRQKEQKRLRKQEEKRQQRIEKSGGESQPLEGSSEERPEGQGEGSLGNLAEKAEE